MNRLLRCFPVALAAAAALLSCSEKQDDDDLLWDFVSPSVCFFVTDAATGENLLDPASEHAILDNPITVTYRGETYPVTREEEQLLRSGAATRALPSRPLALRLENRDPLGNVEGWHLAFGEFAPDGTWRGEKFTIDWGDGRTDEVEFDLYITWKKGDPTIHSPLRLDGVLRGEGYYDAWVIRLER